MLQFNTDCEGPTCVNDNALELATYFIPQGDQFYIQVSRYDDYLAEIAKKERYQPGYTLKLIVPFLKAYGATNEKVKKYSMEHISFVPGAEETFRYLKNKKIPIFIISTSYQQFAEALGAKIGVQREDIYCTRLDFDKYHLSNQETEKLKNFRIEVINLPQVELPFRAVSFDMLPLATQRAIKRLDEIFWEEIPSMKIGKIYEEVMPVGGAEKVEGLFKSLEKTGNELCNVIYVGDSITDVQVLNLVRGKGGLAVSFNGNRYAIDAAEIACISKNTIVTTIFVDIFMRGGKKAVLEAVQNWGVDGLARAGVPEKLIRKLVTIEPKPIIEKVNLNKKRLTRESEAFREEMRGELVGKLG